MMKNKKILAIIPGRGGSKGLPNKNIKLMGGLPLIAHSILYAQKSKYIDTILVSSDSDEILDIASKYKVTTLKRPLNISGDNATTESAISHALNEISEKPDIIILLQPTSPIRPNGSLNQSLDIFISQCCDSLLSISPTHNFFWKISNENIIPQYDYNKRPRRQDIKEKDLSYKENGSLYIFSYEHFKKRNNRLGGKIGYIIFSEEYSLEIDTQMDFEIVEKLFNKINEGKINDK